MENEQLIQNYEQGKLSAEDQRAFESRLKTDKDFAQEVKEYQDLKASIKAHERADLKKMLQSIDSDENLLEEKETEEVISFGKRYRHIYAAAAIIIFAVIAFQFFEKEPSTQDLYASYYEPYPNTLQPVVRGENDENMGNQAFLAYEAGEYEKASNLFKMKNTITPNPDEQFYQAMSLLALGKDQEAIFILEQLKKTTTSFKPQLYWYSALIALKNNQKSTVVQQLDSLSALKSGYKDRTVAKIKEQLE